MRLRLLPLLLGGALFVFGACGPGPNNGSYYLPTDSKLKPFKVPKESDLGPKKKIDWSKPQPDDDDDSDSPMPPDGEGGGVEDDAKDASSSTGAKAPAKK